ncbi:MAG: hypothetical protein LBL67_03920 [Coriobacteriales bacterium]|nr:hypothetical protein [Coriobacteriales bacterium]
MLCITLQFRGNCRLSPELAAAFLEAYPRLGRHACKGLHGGHFADNIVGTSYAHLFEHLLIELAVCAHPGQVFAGNTKCLDPVRQLYQVRLRCVVPGESGCEPAV